MTQQTIKTATASDAEAVMAIVVLAFSADPAARWAYRDPQQYLTHFPSFVSIFGGNAFAHASAYYVEGYVGAALWLPPEVHPDEETLIPLLQRTVVASLHQDLFAVFEQMGDYPPEGAALVFAAHWCRPVSPGTRIRLGVIAARPDPLRSRPQVCLSRIHEPEEYPAL